MTKKQTAGARTLQTDTLQISRIHFIYVFAYAGLTGAYGAWKLVTPEALAQRWMVAIALFMTTLVAWYAARHNSRGPNFYQTVLSLLISIDIFVAAFTVYSQRGMASRAVLLFCLPIAMSAALRSKTALYGTAAVSAMAYSLAAIKYFMDYPSEGYKVELYGDVLFYSALFFVLAAMLSALAINRNSKA